MGIRNHECIIATTWDDKAMGKVRSWVMDLPVYERALFTFHDGLVNNEATLFVAPSGSKKGWEEDLELERIRNKLVELICSFDYEDGSNPFYFVEVGFGEYGQKILRGNCKNVYNDKPYAED